MTTSPRPSLESPAPLRWLLCPLPLSVAAPHYRLEPAVRRGAHPPTRRVTHLGERSTFGMPMPAGNPQAEQHVLGSARATLQALAAPLCAPRTHLARSACGTPHRRLPRERSIQRSHARPKTAPRTVFVSRSVCALRTRGNAQALCLDDPRLPLHRRLLRNAPLHAVCAAAMSTSSLRTHTARAAHHCTQSYAGAEWMVHTLRASSRTRRQHPCRRTKLLRPPCGGRSGMPLPCRHPAGG